MKKIVLSKKKSGATEPKTDTELELVSTQMLKRILTSRDRQDVRAVEDAARTATEGVLVRNSADRRYEILDEEEFDRLVEGHPDLPNLQKPADLTASPLRDYAADNDFSLVSSKALRRALGAHEDDTATGEQQPEFDPYRR